MDHGKKNQACVSDWNLSVCAIWFTPSLSALSFTHMAHPTTAVSMTPNWFSLFPESETQVAAWISACLTDISQWMSAHNLKINLDKTELLFLPGKGSPQNPNRLPFWLPIDIRTAESPHIFPTPPWLGRWCVITTGNSGVYIKKNNAVEANVFTWIFTWIYMKL